MLGGSFSTKPGWAVMGAAPAPGEDEVLQDLAAVGYAVESLADLRSSGVRYRDAIPVLIAGLARVADRKVKGEIVRAMSVLWAKPAATGSLIEEFKRVEDETGMGLLVTISPLGAWHPEVNAVHLRNDGHRFGGEAGNTWFPQGWSDDDNQPVRTKLDGTWRAIDTASERRSDGGLGPKAGGSTWKDYRETPDGLRWYRDADQFGDYIDPALKHKSDAGMVVWW